MLYTVWLIYCTTLLLATIIGIVRYKHVDFATQLIVVLLGLTTLSESTSIILMTVEEYHARCVIFHFYNIFQLLLLSLFFIYAIDSSIRRKLVIVCLIICPLVGGLNILLFQPLTEANTNMLIFESFAIITMSLYYIYWSIKKDNLISFFKEPHFRITLLQLLLWGSTFFFWSFIAILYKNNWLYTELVTIIHVIVNIVTYAGIGIVLYLHPKKIGHENN